jgi:hypothetical protein
VVVVREDEDPALRVPLNVLKDLVGVGGAFISPEAIS